MKHLGTHPVFEHTCDYHLCWCHKPTCASIALRDGSKCDCRHEWECKVLTADWFVNNGGFTLIRLRELFAYDWAETWEAYFSGGFDANLNNMFENAINPTALTVAYMMRGFAKTYGLQPRNHNV